ncbi:pyridoxamine 5'-phosphate oxidase family protein [Burkholderia sp. ABCPW 111]|uniref:pyridoxamine 5'-phosphate oxidase family protein n=1 Tax=Burkholderia sp. ABCPW 111 TaxID=1820025 RepID=UPI00053189AF|nr:pyridoxamine 5'-phosphate oxidase family protein [Burkholderia sp. ABCPW 111]KGS03420.1 pyridoxamine 5'-phosphate oxidase, FMN-binding family protein [Burkholderia sp. ABCPW 111]
MLLTTLEQLEAHYGKPSDRSLWKEIPHLSDDYRAFVAKSPFIVLASSGPDGLDCSPRGDRPGFVRVLDPHTLAIPDRPGNNRVDTLRNIVANGRIGVLFVVPGIGETLRVNGRAKVSIAPELLASFAVDGKPAKAAIVVDIEAVYFHCSKAFLRSQLWDASRHVPRAELPSPGAILKKLAPAEFDAEQYERELEERNRTRLY